MATTEVVRRRNVVANLSRHKPGSSELVEARRELAAEKLADYIRRTVDAAPPLTVEQRTRLAGLFRPIAGGGDQVVS